MNHYLFVETILYLRFGYYLFNESYVHIYNSDKDEGTVYALKFKYCLILMKIHMYHLEYV